MTGNATTNDTRASPDSPSRASISIKVPRFGEVTIDDPDNVLAPWIIAIIAIVGVAVILIALGVGIKKCKE